VRAEERPLHASLAAGAFSFAFRCHRMIPVEAFLRNAIL
jgi:hypothetical protein